ncbi:MAG: hypothetical protein EOO63_12590 [Hymenobacter sp.]|nr:MAG: hypothetical protein EOO63_12590 [Hymenobacter sp.]
MLEHAFDVNLGLLDRCALLADVGCLGLVTDYDVPLKSLPHRKPRRSKQRPDVALTAAQRSENAPQLAAPSRANTRLAGPTAWVAWPKRAATRLLHCLTASWPCPVVAETGI